MSKGNTFTKIAIGTAIAGAAGYVVGVLSAPNEGKKTRDQLKQSADHGLNELEKQLKELHTELGDIMYDAKDSSGKLSESAQNKFSRAIESARDAKNKLREVISAIHEGEASDKDLDKALEDAKRAISHLKEFIKK